MNDRLPKQQWTNPQQTLYGLAAWCYYLSSRLQILSLSPDALILLILRQSLSSPNNLLLWIAAPYHQTAMIVLACLISAPSSLSQVSTHDKPNRILMGRRKTEKRGRGIHGAILQDSAWPKQRWTSIQVRLGHFALMLTTTNRGNLRCSTQTSALQLV